MFVPLPAQQIALTQAVTNLSRFDLSSLICPANEAGFGYLFSDVYRLYPSDEQTILKQRAHEIVNQMRVGGDMCKRLADSE